MGDGAAASRPAVPVSVGDRRSCTATITERHVAAFAELTGDVAQVHLDEAAMRNSRFGGRIVHGALLIGLIGTTVTMLVESPEPRVDGAVPVVLGYRDIRFLAPVRIGDAVTAALTVVAVDRERATATAEAVLSVEGGVRAMVGTVTIRWVADDSSSRAR